MLKKSILSFIGVILGLSCLTLGGCAEKYDFEEVRAEFSQYPSDPNVTVVLDDNTVYFYDHEVHLYDLVPKTSVFRWYISREYIFFSDVDYSDERNNSHVGNLVLYRCDLYGNDLQRLYEKNEVRVEWFLRNNHVFYFSYSLNDVKYIDSYDVLTGETKNVFEGKDCDIKDYQENQERKYTVDCTNGKASIVEKASSETFVVDENYLKTTPYYESIGKFPYDLEQVHETKGRLFLFYRLQIEGFFEVLPDYTYAIFEFSYETKEMIYKLLIQANDVAAFEVYLL